MVLRFIAESIALLSDPVVVILIFIGMTIGLIIGTIPGLGGVVALTLMLPLTFSMEPIVALAFLAAAKGGTTFAGSITTILLNIPGTSSNTATLLDGPKLADKGEASTAIGLSAVASALGAIVGILVLILITPLLQDIVLFFAPPEFFVMVLVGLASIALAIRGGVLPGLIGAALGLLFSFHGFNPITGGTRYVWGTTYLTSGINAPIAIIGVFAVAEALDLARKEKAGLETDVELSGDWRRGARTLFKHKLIFIQSSVVGIIVGAIPAVGGSIAGFISHMQARNISNNPDKYATGFLEGVLATEAANDSKDAGDLIPTLSLGIPGSASAAVLLGGFVLHGVRPGPRFLVDHLDIAYAIFLALLLANIFTSIIGLALADKLAKIANLDNSIIAASIISISVVGSFAIRNNPYDMIAVLFFGILGFMFVITGISRIAFVIGLILGPIAENSFHQAVQTWGYTVFFTRPLSLGLILLFSAFFLIPILRQRHQHSG